MSVTSNRWIVLGAVMLANLPIVIDMTILHIAVPSLSIALQASGTEALWIIDIYSLLMAGLLVPMGTLADRVGHRRMLLIGLIVFGLASLGAAYSPTAPALIAARAVLAVGGAMIMPSVLAIIRQTFDDSGELSLALGLWGTVASAGAAVGPLVGGALLEHFWWGSVFLINAPVMLIIFPIVWLALPIRRTVAAGQWAIGQALLLIAAIIAIVYAIKRGFGTGGFSAAVLVTLAFGMALLFVFVRKQLTAATPMLDLGLFARPAITAGMVMAVVVAGSLAGVELTIAQEMQYAIGRTPLEAALFMLPLMAASLIGGPFAGAIVTRFGLRLVASASLLVSAFSLAGLGMSDFHQAGIGVILYLATLGLALSVGLTASSIAIMSSVAADKAGAAGALEITGYELGAGLGITAFGVLLSSIYSSSIRLPQDLAGALADQATHSIGETLIVARRLGAADGQALAASAQAAFSSAHAIVLLTAASLIAVLSIFVFFALRRHHGRSGLPSPCPPAAHPSPGIRRPDAT